MVCSSGITADRLAMVIPIALNLPVDSRGCAAGMLLNEKSTSPPASAVNEGEVPLYATWVMSVFIMSFSISPERCCVLPVPDEE